MTATAFPGSDAGPFQARHRAPYDSVLETIGWTPLIRLRRLGRGTRTPLYGKAEFFNPGGSVKDRIGLPIVEAAERSGALKPGGTIVEGTSGNTGVGLAIAAAMKGYKCIFTMPDKMSQEKVRLLKAFGAEVIITPTAVPPDHPDNYVEAAKRIARETAERGARQPVLQPGQPRRALRDHGPRAVGADGRAHHALRRRGRHRRHAQRASALPQGAQPRRPDRRRRPAGVDPRRALAAGEGPERANPQGRPYKVEGIGQDKLPGTLDLSLLDEYVTVNDRDAFAMARRLTREEGLFVGGSAGLITHAALQLARRLDDPEACVVSFLCDTGERYLSKLYNDEWMRENQLLEPDRATLAHLLVTKNGGDAPALVTTAPGALVRQAIGLMKLHDVSQLPVMDGAATPPAASAASPSTSSPSARSRARASSTPRSAR
jgi:cystathionine beta-synthase